MDKRLFFYLFPALLLLALMYSLVHFFTPPETAAGMGAQPSTGRECAPGETRACVTAEGCAGYRPCRLGNFGECVVERECTPGETGICPFTVCTVGQRVCGKCGKWGPCEAPPGCGEDVGCAANDTN